jgi:hypothetical protein
VVPTTLAHLLGDPDEARCERVMQALLSMRKIDLAALHAAHAGRARGLPARPRPVAAALS